MRHWRRHHQLGKDDALLAGEVTQAVSGCCGDSSYLMGAVIAFAAVGDACIADALHFHVVVDGDVVAVVVEMTVGFQS